MMIVMRGECVSSNWTVVSVSLVYHFFHEINWLGSITGSANHSSQSLSSSKGRLSSWTFWCTSSQYSHLLWGVDTKFKFTKKITCLSEWNELCRRRNNDTCVALMSDFLFSLPPRLIFPFPIQALSSSIPFTPSPPSSTSTSSLFTL